MRKINVLTLLAVVALGTTMLSAQASRTWVSGVGDDANPCSRTAPCKTFAGAISKTAAAGEIDVIDPGGFGTLTITKALTIDGKGPLAAVLAAGTNGIVVAAGPNDVVILRNISFNGFGTGINAIRFVSGKALIIENCQIFEFTTQGIDIALTVAGSSVSVRDTVISNVGGDGIKATTTVGHVQVGVERTKVELANIGIEAADHADITVKDSFIEHGASAGIQADSPSGDAQVSVDTSEISFNNNGLTSGPGLAAIAVANSKIAYNAGTAMNQAGGTISSFGTNRIHSNGAVGTFATVAQQ
jgi:hypothetical protein